LLDCPYVFHKDGNPIGNIRKTWEKVCVALGLAQFEELPNGKKKYVGLHVHDLRRSGIRKLIRSGVRETVAMGMSGHKTRAVFDRYNIVSDEDLIDALTKADSWHEREAAKGSKIEKLEATRTQTRTQSKM